MIRVRSRAGREHEDLSAREIIGIKYLMTLVWRVMSKEAGAVSKDRKLPAVPEMEYG